MHTWLNGWIHFCATKGDEDRANRLRHFEKNFIDVLPTQSGPTSSSVTDDDSLDGDDVTDEAVVIRRISFQDGISAVHLSGQNPKITHRPSSSPANFLRRNTFLIGEQSTLHGAIATFDSLSEVEVLSIYLHTNDG